jgi:hypothetical protein
MCGRTDVAPGARLTDVVEEMGGFEVTQLRSVGVFCILMRCILMQL